MLKTYTLKLSSGTAYKLYDGATLVTDADLGTLFGAAGSAYFVFDFNSGTPSDLTAVSITNSSDTEVMGITGLAAGTVKENYNFKGAWDGATTTFTSFAQLTGQAMDEAQLGFLMEKVKESLGNVGMARGLTSSDYNAHATQWSDTDPANFDCVALWKLVPGTYYLKDEIRVYMTTFDSAGGFGNTARGSVVIIGAQNTVVYSAPIVLFRSNGAATYYRVNRNTGARELKEPLLGESDIKNNLTTTVTGRVLDASQGKVLKDLIDSLVVQNAGAPTTATVGTVGKLYEDTTNGKLYQCTAIADVSGTTEYTWSEIGSPTIVQTVGSSETSVMSQKAASKMIFRNPDVKDTIFITDTTSGSGQGVFVGPALRITGGSVRSTVVGPEAKLASGDGVIAIGYNAGLPRGNYRAGGQGSIALGATAEIPAEKGVVNIGSYGVTWGYQGTSSYRLLTGLYDGQSAHDAATYGQLSTAILNGGTTAPTTATVGAVGTLYSYVDTTGTPTPHLMVCTAVTDVSGTTEYTWTTLI